MELTLLSRKNFEITKKTEEWAEKRFSKLDKFFGDNASAKLSFAKERSGLIKVEATITTENLLYRAETSHEDALVAIDNAEKIITRQLMRNKTRVEKSLRDKTLNVIIPTDTDAVEEEKEFQIVRNKKFNIKPMSAEEAILQMNLLGHGFFLFQEAETMKTCLVYKRNEGHYGLIEV